MPVIHLTQSMISELTSQGKRRIEYCDKDLAGLFLEVRETGQSTWYFRYRDVNSHTQTTKLGGSIDITLAQARSHAKSLRAEVALGGNPRADEKAAKAVITLDDFFNDHYLAYAKSHKRSWARDEELYRLRIKAVLGNKRLNQITRLQVQNFHASVLNEGLAAASANHHAKLIRRMFNLAISWDMLEKNPASRIQMFEEDNKQERYMNDAQLGNLLEVLRTDSCRSVCLITMFLLATGCRLGEVLSATWSQVDKEKRVFRVLASNSKSKRMRPVPLNFTAITVLNQLDSEGVHDNLFINKKTKLPYVSIAKVWDKLRKKAGLPHLRLHDLRHQAASHLINSGSSLYIVQQILGHSDPSVTQRYAHLSMKSLNDASDNASAIIKGAMKQEVPVVV
ncbi:site-specific integrase [Methylotenera sp.]|uniref:site-specific integrase n=1 Tax=Methylotenera sp. TaxID=2051956 RepID=UPI002488FB7D|nr:site-specific integrase [Methylotenera sp.]MDI1361808.1 tyrosine-type recombinase/integrase [Methylotenera sp.]